MKKLTLSLLSLLCLSATAFAAPVDRTRATETATRYMQAVTGKNFSVKNIIPVAEQYYIVNLAPGGWIIISADDCAKPVIGYNDTGSLTLANMPENMRGWLDLRGAEVRRAAEMSAPMSKTWETAAPERLSRATGIDVEPLIKVNWNQDSPYNSYVAQATGDPKVYVGCVAVAMSQAMSVQRWPDRPTGSTNFVAPNYGNMSINYTAEQPYDWNAILSGANKYNEAARLMYHAGMGVSMGYGNEGSGIPSNEVYRITDAYHKYFKYTNAKYYWREKYKDDWEQLLVNELTAGRAIVYNAADLKNGYGHSFNIDGYHVADNKFHVNWGWGGVANGWMSIDALIEASMGMYYYDLHVAIVGIGAPNRTISSIEVPITTIEENLPAGTVVSNILVNGEVPTSMFSFKLQGEYDSKTGSYKEVPFEVKTGDDGNCYLYTTRELKVDESPIRIIMQVTESKENTSLSQGFVFNVTKQRKIDEATSMTYNRETGVFNITTKHNCNYKLANAQGATVASGTLNTLPTITFKKSDLTEGTNTLSISNGAETKVLKIKK